MKTQYRNMLWLAALSLAFAMGACQNEELAEAGPSVNVEEKTVLRATMGSYNASQSRAQVVLGNEDEAQEVFMWNEEDAFMVYNQEEPSVSSLFTISGYDEWNTPSAEATFISEGEISEGTKVTAIYPAPDTSAVKDGVVTLAFADPNGTSVGDNSERRIQEYMKTHMLMYATATMEGTNTNLTFQHLCAMARVSYTNATGTEQKISKVTVGTGTNCMNHSMTFNLKDNTYEVNKNSVSVSLTFSDLTVASGRTVDFYLLFIPSGNLLGNADTVKVSINDYKVGMPASEIASQKFEAGKRYWLKVMQTQADGLVWKKDAPETLITNLPLISYLEEYQNANFIKDENGYVNVWDNIEQISQITSIGLDYAEGIESVDGIEYFTNLTSLNVANMGLTSLDVSMFPNLETLECWNNQLEKLDVSANPKLTNLTCYEAGLSELDVTHNPELLTLNCGGNNIAELDLSQNLKLQGLDVGGEYGGKYNPIASLDISNNTELNHLNLIECHNIINIDVSKQTKLESFLFPETGITSINLKNNPALSRLTCYKTPITQLDLSNNKSLTFLYCDDTNITALDVNNNPLLNELRCGDTQITELDVSKNPLLEILWCRDTQITTLNLSNNSELTKLNCGNCCLKELDITNNPKLTWIPCGRQRENNEFIELKLYLTQEQMDILWANTDKSMVENVTPIVKN